MFVLPRHWGHTVRGLLFLRSRSGGAGGIPGMGNQGKAQIMTLGERSGDDIFLYCCRVLHNVFRCIHNIFGWSWICMKYLICIIDSICITWLYQLYHVICEYIYILLYRMTLGKYSWRLSLVASSSHVQRCYMGTLRISPDTGVKFDNVAGIDEAKEVPVGEDEWRWIDWGSRVVVLLPYGHTHHWCT